MNEITVAGKSKRKASRVRKKNEKKKREKKMKKCEERKNGKKTRGIKNESKKNAEEMKRRWKRDEKEMEKKWERNGKTRSKWHRSWSAHTSSSERPLWERGSRSGEKTIPNSSHRTVCSDHQIQYFYTTNATITVQPIPAGIINSSRDNWYHYYNSTKGRGTADVAQEIWVI